MDGMHHVVNLEYQLKNVWCDMKNSIIPLPPVEETSWTT